jgi:hypothetical protein
MKSVAAVTIARNEHALIAYGLPNTVLSTGFEINSLRARRKLTPSELGARHRNLLLKTGDIEPTIMISAQIRPGPLRRISNTLIAALGDDNG